MKTCPVCGSAVFDDMDICYGCLHSFMSKVGPSYVAAGDESTVLGATRYPLPREFDILPEGTVVSECSSKAGEMQRGKEGTERAGDAGDKGGAEKTDKALSAVGGSAREDCATYVPDCAGMDPKACGGFRSRFAPVALSCEGEISADDVSERSPGGKSRNYDQMPDALGKRNSRAADLLARIADLQGFEPELCEVDPLQPDDFCLCVDQGDGQVIRYRFNAGHPLLVGRSQACDVSIKDPMASRRHMRVGMRDGKVLIEDLGSTNHTYVDGLPLEGRQIVALGACITIARAKIWAERAGVMSGLV